MRRSFAFVLAVIGGTAALVGAGTNVAARASAPAQAESIACLHDANETPAQTTRRRAAIQVARNVNTSESQASSVTSAYQPLERMQALLTAPAGFSLVLSTDGQSYLFVLKDKTDKCRFTIFSDQDGLIYQGAPLQ